MKPSQTAAGTRGWVLVVCAALVLAAGQAAGGIINPSFETGDLTGWSGLAAWSVFGDGWASDGGHYASMVSPPPHPSLVIDDDSWLTYMEQAFTMPAWAETMSVDVRDDGLDVSVAVVPIGGGTPVLLTNNPSGPLLFNGYKRYVADVSSLAGLDVNVGISVGLDHVPPTPHRAAVDNFRIVPEPGTLLMLLAAASIMALRRRGIGPHARSQV